MSDHKAHQSQNHTHAHGPYGGQRTAEHEGSPDYLRDGKLHHRGEKVETPAIDVNPESHASWAPAHSDDGQISAELTSIRPLHDRVVVECVKEADKSQGGIIIPDTAKEKPTEGHVLAVGTGRVLANGSVLKVAVNVGDRVLFGKYGGTEVKLDGADRLIIREDDILAVFER